MQTNSDNKQTVNQLNSFLRGELSAVESYRLALSNLPTSDNRSTLEQCARSHEARAELLSAEVRRLGGEPSEGSGAWGAFAKLVTGGAQVFGEKAAILALEEGEDHGRNDYRRDLDELEPGVRNLILQRVVPEQQRTHDAMSVLKKTLS